MSLPKEGLGSSRLTGNRLLFVEDDGKTSNFLHYGTGRRVIDGEVGDGVLVLLEGLLEALFRSGLTGSAQRRGGSEGIGLELFIEGGLTPREEVVVAFGYRGDNVEGFGVSVLRRLAVSLRRSLISSSDEVGYPLELPRGGEDRVARFYLRLPFFYQVPQRGYNKALGRLALLYEGNGLDRRIIQVGFEGV